MLHKVTRHLPYCAVVYMENILRPFGVLTIASARKMNTSLLQNFEDYAYSGVTGTLRSLHNKHRLIYLNTYSSYVQ